jgi:aminomethyltransferase
MKNTALTDLHIKMGARMQPFAGFSMPVEYSGINDEHTAVRDKAGVFDVSHMGEFRVRGPKASAFLQNITTNDIFRLTDGMVQYSCFPNGKGGIVDDLLVYRFDRETYMLVVNAANIEKDWEWCALHARAHGLAIGTDLYNASDDISLIALQGPLALNVMQQLTGEAVSKMKFYTFGKFNIAGIRDAVVSATGYTGSGGYEIYVDNKDACTLWNAIFEAGGKLGIKPAGLGARDTLRLEMGYCLYGNDIDETTSPIEAGLGWITKFTEGNNFIDRDLLLKQKKEGTDRKLAGFVLRERGIPRQHYQISDNEGKIIGRVTSGTMSPMLRTGIGLGYIQTSYATEGTEIKILIRNKSIRAGVVKPPFYQPE